MRRCGGPDSRVESASLAGTRYDDKAARIVARAS